MFSLESIALIPIQRVIAAEAKKKKFFSFYTGTHLSQERYAPCVPDFYLAEFVNLS